MKKTKNEVKEKKKHDVESSIKSYVNVMFTQMQATCGFNLFGERAVASTIKELKQMGRMTSSRKKYVTKIDPDILSVEDKTK